MTGDVKHSLSSQNSKVSYKLISTLWASKFSTKWKSLSWKHEGHGGGSNQAFSKYASLQCLCNISRKVMNGVHFGIHQDQNFYKLDYRFLLKVARHVKSSQKKEVC